jgi:hypothetical protein
VIAETPTRRNRMKRAVTLTLLAVMVVALLAAPAALCAGSGPRASGSGKVVILVIDRISVRDLTPRGAPFLTRLANDNSTGLMATHSAEHESGKEMDLGADYTTLGSGVRQKGSLDAALSFDAGEILAGAYGSTDAARYLQQSGGARVPPQGVASLGLASIKEKNKGAGTDDNVGLLGAQLASGGKRPAVVGNEDGFRRRVRMAPLIVTDASGVTPLGRLAGLTVSAPREPGGVVTDLDQLALVSKGMLSRCDVLVVDTGDTGRVDREAASTGKDALEAARSRALKRVDSFAERIAASLDLKSSLLLVVSPSSPLQSRLKGDYATPFIAAGKGFTKGLLSSGSTRRAGFVSNADFLPTVLDFFGQGAPPKVTGAAMETARQAPANQTSLAYLTALDRQYVVTRTARWPIVLGYLIGAVGLLLLFALACIPRVSEKLAGYRWRERAVGLLEPISTVVLALPVSFLIVSAFSFGNWLFPLGFCVAFALVLGLIAWFAARGNARVEPATLVCLFSAAVMIVDLIIGGRLLIFPLLGSSVQDGARFFGQSNAVAGMMIAYFVYGLAGLAGESASRRGPARWLVMAALAFMAFVMGFGALGGDFGGFIAAAATLLVFFFATSRGGFKSWRVPAIAGITIAATAVMVMTDALFVHTHAGHALAAGSSQFFPLVGRKALVLLSQINSVLFLAILMISVVLSLLLWMKKPDSWWKQRWEVDRTWTGALFALLIGSVVALVFNDTGIGMMGSIVMVTIPVAASHFARLERTGKLPAPRLEG